ncbi:MAG: hypothetical protein GY940_46580, partial [bacterium]|nr:hypothetical protein [bacterium]
AFYREVFFFYFPDEFDGYITTGGTEGNYIGLCLAKRKFKENGVLFLTPGSHYSISKGASIFELPTEKVNADEIYGCMVRESLETKIREHLETNPNLGVVININMGTTVKGAIDSIAMVKEVLDECGITEENRYIHCDAALHGNILPFLDSAGETMPFTLDPSDKYYAPIDSIAISGHKFVGAPYPCGLGLYRKAELENVRGEILESLESATAGVSGLYPNHAVADYFEMYGTITSGSSNSYMAVAIWKRIRELGREGLTEFARNCIAVTNYTVERMKEVSPITGITPFINKNSNIVILNPCPSKHIMEKWGLPEEQGISHLDIMPHVSTELIDEFIEDLMNMP